ncbi:Frataxin [Penicillium malachiteum]|uniref:Frataxin n=1 Tax=Penicillium malachiteum TaxID=1324776 RepID=UPI002548A887|nr:Frataxin [Penicillium malachiteum]KAJ5720778.1 Frataxin [Penicillium malachiteum]
MFSRRVPHVIRWSLRAPRSSSLAPKPRTNQAIVLRRNAPELSRSFYASATRAKGLQPDTEDPRPPTNATSVAGAASHVTEPSPLTTEEYHDYSEHYFNVLIAELEKMQEEQGSDIEAEYSAGVLNITVPSIGTYVLNKQPPNKQIWLSSPISGPKRYDWILEGDRMHEKQDTREFAHGQWVYLRDGSNLTELLNSEMKLALPKDIYGVLLDD